MSKDLQSIKDRFGIIGNAPALNYALTVATQVANTDLSVLINGESGVGKEVFSQIIHALSARKHNHFIAVNCGAIPEGTIDSELFGHEKGSFTGATEARKGYFETVSGGTIFLDEIGEMPIGTQARLLRVLETGEYIRVGSSKVQKTDVRVIAATNKDLLQLTQIGKFREDLYYRLNTVPIKVPSLKERKEDIILLFRKFVSDFSAKYRSTSVQLDEEAQAILSNYSFPGNVRELKNIAEQISVLSKSKILSAKDIAAFLPTNPTNNNLPVLAGTTQPTGEFANEREILYKLFFDMKKDVTELKKILFDLVNHNQINIANPVFSDAHSFEQSNITINYPTNGNNGNTKTPVVIQEKNFKQDNIMEEEEIESLNLHEQEKNLIAKALKRYKGSKKLAAKELGLSERSLYRKVKDFGIED